jgi:2-polyprenyl-3-methyl-5-hydroxy-6-metoxy-1,4-benzoquinol methylase
MAFKVEPAWDPQLARRFWNDWGSHHLGDASIGDEALRRGEVALSLLRQCSLDNPGIIEFGCGNGWLSEKLLAFGSVTGVDLADKMIEEARRRVPRGTFHIGDALTIDLPAEAYDVSITLETFAQVQSQPRFVEVMARALRKGGHLILITQNRIVYSRRSNIAPLAAGQIRTWVTMRELHRMLKSRFQILDAFTFEPAGDLGFLRYVNSRKLNNVAARVFSQQSIQHLKERLGLGQTLAVLARRRA